MKESCCEISESLAKGSEDMGQLTKSINHLAKVAREASEHSEIMNYSFRILACRSNRQKRKIRHELLVNARGIERGFDHLGTRQDSAFEQARDRAAKLRDLAEVVRLAINGGENGR